ncbi:MAG: DUF488 family protein [Caulobacteraceae bacterium]
MGALFDPDRRMAIWTVGHSTHPLEAFLAILKTYEIERLADVRTIPRSRRNPQFNAETLGPALGERDLDYQPLGELGGLRRPRKDSVNLGWRNEGFRGFADYMATPAFEEGLARLLALGRARRTAIMCAEAVPWRCHRSLIADALLVRGVEAIEILSATSSRPHRLTPFARVEGTSITYPGEGS